MKRIAIDLAFLTWLLLACHVAIADEPVRIVCLGDSVTKAVRKGVEPHQTFCALLQQQLSGADRPVEVVNAGIGGNTTEDGLKRFQPDVLDHKPHIVVIMFGLNDSWIDAGKTESRLTVHEYRANLDTMLELLIGHEIKIVLMTPNPALAPTYGPERNATLRPYVDVVRSLARHHELPLVDVYQHFAELAQEREINSLFTDDMHPNPAGQQQLAVLLEPVLKRQLDARHD
jgi:lysophospholipase L1-like esterase